VAVELGQVDVNTGKVTLIQEPPPGVGNWNIGANTITFAPDGTAYVSDAVEGSIFRLKPGADALELVGGRARFSSPQGMVVSDDGKTLLVADYTAGLQRLDIQSGVLDQVAVPPGITTLGMDGLVQLRDGSFAATQNGIRPNRVVRFRLSKSWGRLETFGVVARGGGELSDVTLLTPDGNDVLVSGTSQWASFDDDSGTPSRPLQHWHITRVAIP
jgi:streptogramin lyase